MGVGPQAGEAPADGVLVEGTTEILREDGVETAVDDEPTTLSGRPVIDTEATPVRTEVPAGSKAVLILLVTLAVAAVAYAFAGRGPEGTDVRVMPVGACYVQSDVVEDHGRPIPYGKDTPCLESTPRIVGSAHLPLGPFPGSEGLRNVVIDRCGGEGGLIILPTEESWLDGDRTVTCIALPTS